MIRLANIIPALLPFSRGLAFNSRGVPFNSPTLLLSRRAVADIWLWRAVWVHAIADATWLSIPIHIPLLLRRLPGESDTDRASRQSSAASYTIFADACTTINGLGTYIPTIGWAQAFVPSLTTYFRHDDVSQPININALEFLAALLSITHLLYYLRACAIPTLRMHIHVYTDNSNCKSWMTTYCTSHPLHCFLLQVFSLLQTSLGLIVTVGHVKGSLNIWADAASRNFICPEGPSLQAHLSHLPHRFPTSLQFLQRVKLVAETPSLPTSDLVQHALTAVAELISWLSAPDTASTTPLSVVL